MFDMRSIARLISFAAILGCASAAPASEKAKKTKPFLQQVDSSTWVIGNGIWNLTQNRQYANKLWYKNTDLVDEAVGHYVSYSMFIPSLYNLNLLTVSFRWCSVRPQLDLRRHRRIWLRLHKRQIYRA